MFWWGVSDIKRITFHYNISIVQNLQCDWLPSVHYNTTMHAVFFVLSPFSWETNVFSVVFIHKLLYNAGKNSLKMKEKKRLEEKRTNDINDKIKKNIAVAVFAEYEFD